LSNRDSWGGIIHQGLPATSSAFVQTAINVTDQAGVMVKINMTGHGYCWICKISRGSVTIRCRVTSDKVVNWEKQKYPQAISHEVVFQDNAHLSCKVFENVVS
jgi:hypothetical protein